MNKWIVIEIKADGSKRIVGREYDTYADACEVQEAMEWIHTDKSYLIFTVDEWIVECENAH